MMSAGSPTLLDRAQLYLSLVRYSRAHNHDFAQEHHSFFVEMLTYLGKRVGDLKGKRVLDVGCGKSAWLTLLLHSYGASVTGIDTEFAAPGRGVSKYLRLLRQNGVDRSLRTFAWDLLFAGPYYRALASQCSFPLRFDGIHVRPMSITDIDLPARHFDVAVSHEVLEHVADVAGAARSLRRLLKPDGITYIHVHNFASVSGGHHLEWKYPDTEPSRVVPPWDHLRQNRHPDIPSWINRWRERSYKEVFEREFDILDWIHSGKEGEELLTAEIEAELPGYEREELLTKGFVIVGRPKPSTA